MKKFLLTLLLAVLPLSSIAASGTAIPGGSQSTPFVINKPGAYYLAADRVMTNKALIAIQINSSDVTLDLNGYTLSYSDPQDAMIPGIKAYGANIEIRNGSITAIPGLAIHVDGLTDHVGLRLIDLRIADTRGIYAGSDVTRIERCQVTDTRGTAITTGSYSIVKDCSVRNVTLGISSLPGVGINLGGGSVATGCNVHETADAGIVCWGHSVARNNLVSYANQSGSPSSAGILASSRHATVSENSIIYCHAAGIRVGSHGQGNVLEKNIISDTQPAGPQVGVAIASSSASTIVRGNLGHDNAGGFISGSFIDGGANLVN